MNAIMESVVKGLRLPAIIGIIILNSVAWAEEFKVDFELSWASMSLDTQKPLRETRAAGEVYFRDGGWFISFKENNIIGGFHGWQTGSDGRLVYQMERNSLADDHNQFAIIFPGPVPEWDLGNFPVNVVWMAYASHAYLKKCTNDYLPKIISPSRASQLFDTGNYLMKARWTLADAVPPFTRALIFVDDLAPIGPAQPTESSATTNRIGSGLTNAVYACTSITNVDGLVLPLTFSFEMYVHHPTNQQRHLTAVVKGVTRSASAKCGRASLLPDIPESMTVNYKNNSGPRNVTDKRFGKSILNVHYYMRDHWLTNDEELKQLPDYKVAVAQSPRLRPPPTNASLATTQVRSAPAPSAEAVLSQAKGRAAAEQKAIYVHFGASWCGWCKRLDALLARPDFKLPFEKYFVPVKLTVMEAPENTVMENAGAGDLLKQWGGEGCGIPYSAFLNPQATFIVNSKRPSPEGKEKNIGYPGEPEEIDWFLHMIKKAAPSIQESDFKAIETALKTPKKS